MSSRLVRRNALILSQFAAGLALYGVSHGHSTHRRLCIITTTWLQRLMSHITYLTLSGLSSGLVSLRFGGHIYVGHLRGVMQDHFVLLRIGHQLLLLLRLVTRLPYRWRLSPTIRVDVDVDDSASSLSGDLMLRAWDRRSVLADSVDLHLELMRLVATILVLH